MLKGADADGTVTIDGIVWDVYDIPDPSRAGNVSFALEHPGRAATPCSCTARRIEKTAKIAAAALADQVREIAEEATMTERPTPAKVWDEMLRGNARFVAGEPSHPRQDVERRNELAGGQTPRAALFGCSDSRLAAEIIFDKGLGDLFVVRNAGQVISDSVIGSLEYAVAVLERPAHRRARPRRVRRGRGGDRQHPGPTPRRCPRTSGA